MVKILIIVYLIGTIITFDIYRYLGKEYHNELISDWDKETWIIATLSSVFWFIFWPWIWWENINEAGVRKFGYNWANSKILHIYRKLRDRSWGN